jgi:heme exporter protein C
MSMTDKALARPGMAGTGETRAGVASRAGRNDILLAGLTGISGLLLLAAIWMVANTPTEATMGLVQKVFYFHMPSAWAGFLAFGVTFGASVYYLVKRDVRADMVAVASAEVGLVFLTMAIISGSIWARPIWNTWWTWDARLTSTTICWLAYVAYFMLRGALDDPERARRLAAVYGIVAMVTVPITFLSILLLRTIHPTLFGPQEGAEIQMNMAPAMTRTLMFSLFTFTVFYTTLLWHRLRYEGLKRQVEEIRAVLSGQ